MYGNTINPFVQYIAVGCCFFSFVAAAVMNKNLNQMNVRHNSVTFYGNTQFTATATKSYYYLAWFLFGWWFCLFSFFQHQHVAFSEYTTTTYTRLLPILYSYKVKNKNRVIIQKMDITKSDRNHVRHISLLAYINLDQIYSMLL